MNHHYENSYKNVRLVPLQKEHIELLRDWRNRPENTVYLRKIGIITKEMQQRWYQSYLDNNDEFCFAILETKELLRVVGSASLYDFSDGKAEFGKILIGDENAHGKQIGYHALMAILKIAFEDMKLQKVILECHEKNIPAFSIYQKAGFQIVGSHDFSDGCKEYDMELLKEKYRYEEGGENYGNKTESVG